MGTELRQHLKFSIYRKGETGSVPGRRAVAEGVRFSNGKVALAWLTASPSIVVYDSMDAMDVEVRKDVSNEILWTDWDTWSLGH